MSTWQDLKEKLQEGLHLDNLQELRKICLDLLKESDPNPALSVMLLGIFTDLLNLWYLESTLLFIPSKDLLEKPGLLGFFSSSIFLAE